MLIALSGHSNNQPSDRLTNKCKSRCWMKMIGTAQNGSEMPQFGVKIILKCEVNKIIISPFLSQSASILLLRHSVHS